MDLWFPMTVSRPTSSRSVFDDDWQDFASNMGRQMRDMQRDMGRMFSNMEQLEQTRESPLDVRHAEDALALNPIQTDKDGKKKMQMKVDVRHFKPEEIAVKTKDGKLLEVEAKHEEETENGRILRHYHRVFSIPEGVDKQKMTSTLSPEGVLQICAPIEEPEKPAVEAPKDPRPMDIKHE